MANPHRYTRRNGLSTPGKRAYGTGSGKVVSRKRPERDGEDMYLMNSIEFEPNAQLIFGAPPA